MPESTTRFHANSVVSGMLRVHELNDRDDRIEQPLGAKVKLWPHQLTLVARCILYETKRIRPHLFPHVRNHSSIHPNDYLETHVGVICDNVGSGKSYALLALIMAHDHYQPSDNTFSTMRTYFGDRVRISSNQTISPVKTSFLVIPHILVSQWKRYISDYGDDMRYAVISKHVHCKDFVENVLPRLAETDLVVVTCSFYNQIAREVTQANYRVRRVIYDEVDNMNIPNCTCLHSQFFWFVTASYGNLLYPRGNSFYDSDAQRTVWHCNGLHNSGFIKNIFNDLSYNLSLDYFKILFVKNEDEYIQHSINLPTPIINIVPCATPPEIRILRGYANDEVIQCLNARDVAAALRLVNPRQVADEENLIGLQIARFVKDLHNITVRIDLTRSLEYDDPAAQEHDLARLIERQTELNTRIEGIKERVRSTNTCCICYDDIKMKTLTNCCSNAFCFECLTRWLARNSSCPLCKSALINSDLVTLQSDHEHDTPGTSVRDNDQQKDKMANLKHILTTKLDPDVCKVLVFSSYDMSLHHITSSLSSDDNAILGKYRFKCLRGNEAQVQATVKSYRRVASEGTDRLNMLFVNARNFGSGINLENTTDIIMFHKLDSELEKQVIGRAQRMGRVAPLNVWYLLHENEIARQHPSTSTAS
jgi:hypothetical protein